MKLSLLDKVFFGILSIGYLLWTFNIIGRYEAGLIGGFSGCYFLILLIQQIEIKRKEKE